MQKHPDEDWLDEVPENDIDKDEDDEIIWVSKSEIKRDAEALKDLGAELVDLGKNALDKIPLDVDLRAAIELAQRIKKEGRRRQLQLIGKMLRQRDPEPIQTALDKLNNRHNQQVALFHKLEQIRDRLIDEGDDVIAVVLDLYPQADRQQLRSLIRNAKKRKRLISRLSQPARFSNICANCLKKASNGAPASASFSSADYRLKGALLQTSLYVRPKGLFLPY